MSSSRTTEFSYSDWLCGGLIAVAAGVAAYKLLGDVGSAFFYQLQMPATVMLACGQPFAQPAVISQSLLDFLQLRTTSFDCRDLGSVTEFFPPGNMANSHFYLALSVAYLWRWFGVSYHSLWPLFVMLHGAYAVGCFVLGRLFFNRAISIFVGVVLAFSPVALSMLYWMRDYSKAPFIVWSIIFLVLTMRAQNLRSFLTSSLIAAVFIGIGAGFRSDVIIMIPIAVGIITFGAPKNIVFATRIAVIAIFFIASLALVRFGGAGAPGGAGALFLQGASEPFRAYLGLKPAPYDLGWRYLDEIAHSAIAADLRRDNIASYDAGESKPFMGVTQALTRSTSYVIGWIPLFAADVSTRAMKSAFLIAGFPALQAENRRVLDPFRVPYPASTRVAQRTARVFAYFSQPWMPIVGFIGLLVFVFRIFVRSPREAACVAATLVILMMYPSLQFAMRHFFHLEVLFWLGLLSLAVAPFEFRRLLPALPRFALWLGGLVIFTSMVYASLLAIQDRLLKQEMEDLLASPRNQVPINTTAWPNDRIFVNLPVPAQYRALTDGVPDSMNQIQIRTTPPFRVLAMADRVAMTLGGPVCPPGPMKIETVYERKESAWQRLERELTIELPTQEAGDVTIILPAFYRPTQYLKGFTLPARQLSCLRSIERIEDSRRLPAVMSATLYPDWKRRPLYLRGGY